ncbi:MAG: GDP-L-fucose synthase [Thermoanaerobaculia bacterium]|nr:GDP-L-fucose synthase [Thermoanaerobaculia bacterium]
MLSPSDRIFVAGARGLVGSSLVRALADRGFSRLLTPTSAELDLTEQADVRRFFAAERPDVAVIAAGLVGGIVANSSEMTAFLYENLMIAANSIHAAAEAGVGTLLYLGSSCIYPRLAPQPIHEDSLLTGSLEKTNEGYALAKIAGLKLCEYYNRDFGRRFISAMPTNLYGPNDNFDPTHSHVVPGMMRRFHEAKLSGAPEVVVWGSGTPRREFLHVTDLAEALVMLLDRYEEAATINVGCGRDVTIAELAETMKRVTGYPGRIVFDTSKPDGTPRKLLDVSRIQALGWAPRIELEDGLRDTYAWAVREGKL